MIRFRWWWSPIDLTIKPTIIRSCPWTYLRSEERNRSPPQTRRPLNLLVRCHGPTSLTEYTCSTSSEKPSAQCSFTQRTKPPKRNYAAPSTTSRVTTTPTTLTLHWGDEETPQRSVQRTLFKLEKPTGVGDHCNATGHSVSMDNLKVLDREQEWMKRKVKEAIHIKQRAPTMNRDQGYQLSPIYGQIIPRPPPSEPNYPP